MKKQNKKKHYLINIKLIKFVAIVFAIWILFNYLGKNLNTSFLKKSTNNNITSAAKCDNHSKSKLVIVSISARELWACSMNKLSYKSPVITGYIKNPDNLTPVGVYYIQSKQTDQVLTGSDKLGSWKDKVKYWMPFLYNQYGAYGLHDAQWRNPNEFGNTSPYSEKASHGCVELPLQTATFIYNWVNIGTEVDIVN